MDSTMPTAEMVQAERDACCVEQDDRVLCIEREQDTTECGEPIPEWAFC